MISEKNTKQELLDEYKRLIAQAKSSKKSVPSDICSMNLKNTKSDIWSAIQKLNKLLSAKETKKDVVVEKKPEETKTEVVVEKTSETVKSDSDKKSTENKEENDLNYLSQEIKNEIAALDTAKCVKKNEYDNLLIVEKELVKFVEMINDFKNKNFSQEIAHLQEEENVKAKLAEKTEKSEAENLQCVEAAEACLEKIKNDIKMNDENTASERASEEEEYAYKTAKKYKEEDDIWQDKVAACEETITAVKNETEALQAVIDSKAEEVAEYLAKIDQIPELLEKAKAEAAEAKEKELGKEYGYKKRMAQKDADSSIQSLEKQIEHIKTDYETVMAEKNAIQAKLDKAYEESNKLYMQTVQSTGGIKILSNSDKN